MADKLSPQHRSNLMSRIRSKDTAPELVVRRIAHRLGYRFRLHRKDLPGRPDLVFPRIRKVIFVHGCFWHRHDCKRASMPTTNEIFWRTKFEKNVLRDREVLARILELEWEPLVVWECETSNRESLRMKIEEFLSN